MDLNDRIRVRREELGLADVEIATRSGLNIHSYCGIESYPDELCEVVPLRAVRQLCFALQLDLLDLLDLPCAFCKLGEKYQTEYSLAPNELIRRQRENLGWSVEELGERVNYRGIEISELEASSNHIENWRIHDLKLLSAALKVPLQLLLGVRCPKCGR